MGLTKKEIKILKEKMILEKERISSSFVLDAQKLEVNSDQTKDETDQTNADLERSRMLRFRNRDLFYAKKLELALTKLNNGDDYGCCEECGVDIKFERLLARPTAQMCITCKDEAEREESNNFIGRQSKSLNKTFNQVLA
ncbi:MAG: TraR/DksA family transcriptional regulator [Bacteriovoracaceae bacterium]|jgi:DnaK suppressor protein|nr:TraR/DksA family transcriptional regulator [Bacteriovoracaceae bacterium]